MSMYSAIIPGLLHGRVSWRRPQWRQRFPGTLSTRREGCPVPRACGTTVEMAVSGRLRNPCIFLNPTLDSPPSDGQYPRHAGRGSAGAMVWGRSSAGRATRSQCVGREFDPPRLHQFPSKSSDATQGFVQKGRTSLRRDVAPPHAALAEEPSRPANSTVSSCLRCRSSTGLGSILAFPIRSRARTLCFQAKPVVKPASPVSPE